MTLPELFYHIFQAGLLFCHTVSKNIYD
jgi:hypothetical protein